MAKNIYISDLTKDQMIKELNSYSKADKMLFISLDYHVETNESFFTVDNRSYQSRYGLSKVKIKGSFTTSGEGQKLAISVRPDLMHILYIVFFYVAFASVCFFRDEITINGEQIVIDSYFKIKWIIGSTLGFGLLAAILLITPIKLVKSWTIKKLKLKKVD